MLTVPFKSNQFIQKQPKREDEEMAGDEGDESPEQSAQEKAREKLMGFLFKYARKFAEKKDQESISVGVVGFTNTGKSSLINVLRNKVVVQTSSTAFLTRALREVRLSNAVTLIDSPGLLVQGLQTDAKNKEEEQSQKMRFLRSALQVDEIENPAGMIPSVLAKVEKPEILRHYRIADFDSVPKLLELLAFKKGLTVAQETPAAAPASKKSKKSAAATQTKAQQVADVDAAAKRVLRDFLNNRLNFCSKVPKS